jgi:hypothetical protein
MVTGKACRFPLVVDLLNTSVFPNVALADGTEGVVTLSSGV